MATPLGAQSPIAPAAPASLNDAPPPVPREFRGVWVATVDNIDWPSRRDLSTAEQQAELITILDRAVQLRLNAVIFQVRPAGDALYESKIEPWSEFLTGAMGRAPDPYYDPLAFAVAEAHRRGLELHAWFNPFRARHPAETSAVSPRHLSRRRPDLVRRYGSFLWMDPGSAEVRRYTTRVIVDVVRRYDVDAVHIDDYFYPYRERDSRGREIPFPDDATWRRYRRAGGRLSRDDWRRQNVDVLVKELYAAVKAEKPTVKFGISPFGIWRPHSPESVRGLDAYHELFADSRKWLRNGWLDYFAPQLYWAVASPNQSYAELLRWWVEQNTKGRHIWAGNFSSRVAATSGVRWPSSELLEQIRLTRQQPGAGGNVHFSMQLFLQNRDSIIERLAGAAYATPALVPASPWLDPDPPLRPLATAQADTALGRVAVTLTPQGSQRIARWVIRARYEEGWITFILPGAERSHTLATGDASSTPSILVINAVDRAGNESPPLSVVVGKS